MQLYKAKIWTEICVMANNEKEAEDIALANSEQEIKEFGRADIILITNINELPDNWKNAIPYAPSEQPETKRCSEIAVRQIKYNVQEKRKTDIPIQTTTHTTKPEIMEENMEAGRKRLPPLKFRI